MVIKKISWLIGFLLASSIQSYGFNLQHSLPKKHLGQFQHVSLQQIDKYKCNLTEDVCIGIGSYNNRDWNCGADPCITPIVYYTHDGGKIWQRAPLKHLDYDNSLQDLACSTDLRHCVAVGFAGYLHFRRAAPLVYVTTDAGKNWNLSLMQPTPPKGFSMNKLTSVTCNEEGIKCEANGYSHNRWDDPQTPLSYLTEDGGFTWQIK